ncbi:hypothetical protein [Gracilibacillus saliphilus]|uniref:hypothetical protein n=1 Tax=Gracilibacillus saliphilus TaxID=543890 RepID=UPI0013D3FECA|nr:hypothetical protein [Gracilibacillus saliphilus]
MKISSFSTRLTPTAIGQSGTNDSYIYFPKEDVITNTFFENTTNRSMTFIDQKDGTHRAFNMTFGRENRLIQFGPFARAQELNPGDEVILQRVVDNNGQSTYSLNYLKHKSIVVLEYFGDQKQFVTWNQDRFDQFFNNLPYSFEVLTEGGQSVTLTIEDNGLIKKRADASVEFQSYRLNGLQNIEGMDNFKSKHKLILTKNNDGTYYFASRPINWEFSTVEVERGL